MFDQFLQLEAQSCDLLKRVYSLEHELHSSLVPLVQRRRAELERLRARLAAADHAQRQAARLEELERLHAETRAQVDELRAALTATERILAELQTRKG